MAESLKCPECSAPLDYPADGSPAVKCSFCGSTVMLPFSGRVSPQLQHTQPVIPADLLSAMNVGAAVDKAQHLAQIVRTVRGGNKIEAIKLYREAFGVDLSTAKVAVDGLSAGRPVTLLAADRGSESTNIGGAPRSIAYAVQTPAGNPGMRMFRVMVFLLAPVAGILFFAFFSVHRQVAMSPLKRAMPNTVYIPIPSVAAPSLPSMQPAPPGFAKLAMEFGDKGIGPGQFDDARAVALDGKGHIYVGDYLDGRVQVFDTTGNFIRVWSVGQKVPMLSLSASRDGIVYVVTPGHLLCFEGISGRAFGEAATSTGDSDLEYRAAVASISGDIYAISDGNRIAILNSQGQFKSIFDASAKVGEDVSFDQLAVNGLGEIYALDRNKGVFKFAADGRYLNRFGNTQPTGPHPLNAAMDLAVDGQGRVYVSAVNPAVQVFSGDGNFLGSFGENNVAFGLAIDDRDAVYCCFRNDNKVRKFVLNKPAQE